MERLTSVHGECLKCVGCIEQSNCDTECSAVDDCIEKLKIYEDLEEQGLLLRTGDCAGCRYEKDSEMCGVCGMAYSDAYETAESAIAEQENRE